MNIINQFWYYVEAKRSKSKLAERIYAWLNEDNLGSIIVDNNIFWIEKTSSTSKLPKFAYNYLLNWGKKRGLIYL